MIMSVINIQRVIFAYIIVEALILSRVVAVTEMPLPSINELFAEAILYKEHNGTLQLKISWNSSSIKDASIDISAKSTENKYCEWECKEYGLRPKLPEVYLPKIVNPYVPQKCFIEPGCTYDIEMCATYGRRKFSKSIKYIVPDCVENVCACHYTLPNVTISSTFDESHLNVFWNLTSNINLKNYNGKDSDLSDVFILVNKQSHPLIWDHQLISHTVPFRTKNGTELTNGHLRIPLEVRPEQGSWFSIKAHVIDKRGCEGPDHIILLEGPLKKIEKSHEISYMTIIAIITPVVVVILIVTLIMPKIIKQAIHKIQNWRGVYRNVPFGSDILRHSNVIYVSKEILDARSRGEADCLEISRNCLTFGRVIGKGAFGLVYIARADNLGGKPGAQVVAVKTLKKRPTADEMEEFYSEISTMKSVSRHPNIVALLGCCTISQPLLMVMEYVGCGDLLHYLRQVRSRIECRSMNEAQQTQRLMNGNLTVHKMQPPPNGKYLQLLHSSSTGSASDASYITQPDSGVNHVRPSVTTMYTFLSQQPDLSSTSHSSLDYVSDHKELHNFATQIARGMKHLADHQITHRDLAARNILIDEKKTLKISDFGLSRSGIYVNTRNKKVPLRWLSIEAMRDNLYSSKSDVWAFGIVLWEIGTLGGFPYPTVSNHELLAFLKSGQRLQRPENCSEQLYELMLQCWAEKPEDRPLFTEILAYLEPSNQKIYVDFNDLSSDYVFPPTREDLINKGNLAEV